MSRSAGLMFCRRRRDVWRCASLPLTTGLRMVLASSLAFRDRGRYRRFIDSAASRSSSIEAFSSGVRLFRLAFSTFFRLSRNSCSFSSGPAHFCTVVASERNVRIQPTTVLTATGSRCGPRTMRPITNTSSSSLKPISNTSYTCSLSWRFCLVFLHHPVYRRWFSP